MLLIFSLTVSTVLFTCVFNKPVYDALAPWKKKEIWTSCNFFLFCFVRFKCFCLYWIKTKLHSANKAKSFFNNFFHRILKLILKRHLALYVEILGSKFAAIFVKFVCISYFTLQICVNLIPGWHSSSIEKKSWWSLYIFIKPQCMKLYFKLTMH